MTRGTWHELLLFVFLCGGVHMARQLSSNRTDSYQFIALVSTKTMYPTGPLLHPDHDAKEMSLLVLGTRAYPLTRTRFCKMQIFQRKEARGGSDSQVLSVHRGHHQAYVHLRRGLVRADTAKSIGRLWGRHRRPAILGSRPRSGRHLSWSNQGTSL